MSKNNEWLLITAEIGKIKFGKIIYLTIFQKTKKKKMIREKNNQTNKWMISFGWLKLWRVL